MNPIRYRWVAGRLLIGWCWLSLSGTGCTPPSARPPLADKALLTGTVVYAAQISDEEYSHERGRCDLFLSTNTGTPQRLTNHQAHPEWNLGGAITSPRLSPDGERVLFLADYADESAQGGMQHVYIDAAPHPNMLRNVWLLDIPTGKVTPVTKGQNGWNNLAWSPNGRYFAASYVTQGGSVEIRTQEDIHVFDASTLQGRRLCGLPTRCYALAWSADSERLWIESNTLLSLTRQGGKPQPFFTKAALTQPGAKSHSYHPVPSGKQVAFLNGFREEALYVLGDTNSPSRLLLRGQWEGSLGNRFTFTKGPRIAWSADAKRLALTERDERSSQTHLTLIEIASGKAQRIASFAEPAVVVGWTRDDRWIILRFQAKPSEGKNAEGLMAISQDGKQKEVLLTPQAGLVDVDWREIAP